MYLARGAGDSLDMLTAQRSRSWSGPVADPVPSPAEPPARTEPGLPLAVLDTPAAAAADWPTPADPPTTPEAQVGARPPALARVELIGTHLRAEGSVELGSFRRVSDYVNLLDGFFTIHDVVLLSRLGLPTRLTFPDLRVHLEEIGIIGQKTSQPAAPAEDHHVEKAPRRLVVMTAAHLVYGYAYLHPQASMTAFIDATDPPFIPMTNVRVRWQADRRLAGRYPFALIHRSHIIGVATDAGGAAYAGPGLAAPVSSPGHAAELGW